MRGLLISAIPQSDHIRVEVHESCTVSYSDDQETWITLRGDQFERDGSMPVFKDYTAPLNRPRFYRATTGGEEIVAATQRPPTHVLTEEAP